MKIDVDWDLCESNGLCAAEAPEVFELDAQNFLQIHAEEPDASLHEKVRRAAAACPKAAIRLAG
jgi:ferredoxin